MPPGPKRRTPPQERHAFGLTMRTCSHYPRTALQTRRHAADDRRKRLENQEIQSSPNPPYQI